MNSISLAVWLLLFTFAIFWMVSVYELDMEKQVLKAAAIEAGCAQFNPKTGDFEWLKGRP